MNKDLRRERQPLLDALAQAGADVSNPKAIRCPFHEDRNPSAGIYESGNVWRYKCHACDAAGDVFDILARLSGRSVADVLRDTGHSHNGQTHRPSAKPKPQGKAPKAYPDAQAAIDAAGRMIGGSFVAGWTYHNRDGSEALRVIRYALADGDKQYRPIHLAKDGWRIGDPSGPLPLYRRNDLPATGTVWVTEGEKAADAAHKIGLEATTSAHGSGAADKTDWTPLAGRAVCVVPDHDEPGRKYAQDVARLLVKLDPPAKVKIVDLPGLPDKGDVVEYIEARQGQAPESIRGEIQALAARGPELNPADLIGGPVSICLADVIAREIAWLWPERIALGRITLLVGRPGEGKSFLTMDMAARVSTGTPWPDGSDCPAGSVILICAEDDPGDTIKPRLEALEADCSKVHLLAMVRRIDSEGKRHDVLFTLADVAALEQELRKHPDCRLIVVDPIGSFLGSATDAHRDNEVRAVLAPVAKLAEKYGPAVLVVAHRRKSAGSSADDLALGSRAFTGIARAVWHLCRKADADPGTKDAEKMTGTKSPVRLLLPGKNNLAPEGDGLAFVIGGEPARLLWSREPVSMSADDALAVENGNGGGDDHKPGPEPEDRAAAIAWLKPLLAGGAVDVATIKSEHNKAGCSFSFRTVQRAADDLGVIREKNTFNGGWQWRFPRPGGNQEEPAGEDAKRRCQVPEKQENLASCHLGENEAENGDFACQDPEDAKIPDLGILGEQAGENGRQRGRI